MQINRTFIGQFENISGRFAISDPCYGIDVWCRGELSDVKKGMWNAEVGIYDAGEWGKRVALLIAIHVDYNDDAEGDYVSKVADFEVGVDSGQAGIFDASHYKDDSVFVNGTVVDGQAEKGNTWYDHCCNVTLDPPNYAGIIPFGTVSCSGYGDGGYDCTFWRDTNNEIIKVVITFITEDDENNGPGE
jgi:hypothetical protein